MKHLMFFMWLGAMALLMTGLKTNRSSVAIADATAAPTSDVNITEQPFTLQFGDYTAHAVLSYPTDSLLPLPTLILMPTFWLTNEDGNDPATNITSSNLALVANYMAQHGFAVVRYARHYFGDPGLRQPGFIDHLTPQREYQDLEIVYRYSRSQSQVDPKRIILWGAGEQTSIATYMATTHSEIAGLILQDPIKGFFSAALKWQFDNVLLPYLRTIVDTDQDGQITLAEAKTGFSPRAGHLELAWMVYLLDFSLDKDGTLLISLSKYFDPQQQGIISVDDQIIPYFDKLFARFDRNPFFARGHDEATQSPFIIEKLIPKIKQPVLILVGERSAYSPVTDATVIDKMLANTEKTSHKLIIYPELGMTLGPAASILEDDFVSIDKQPLVDVEIWLSRFQK